MKIGTIGAGYIGGNAGRLFAQAGHEVLFSFSTDPQKLADLAAAVGPRAQAGTPAEAAAFGEIVLLSVPWGTIDEAVAQAGSLDGKIVIDTTNQFGPGGVVALPDGLSAAEFNARPCRAHGWSRRTTRSRPASKRKPAGRTGPDRVVMFYACEDAEAKRVVAGLIDDSGFAPVDMGGWGTVRYMEAPARRRLRRGVPSG